MNTNKLAPGATVFLKEFGHGPYVVVDKAASMAIESDTPQGDHSITVRHYVDNSWVVATKDGKYLQYPEALLTTERPDKQTKGTIESILDYVALVFMIVLHLSPLLIPVFVFICCLLKNSV